MGNSKNRGKPLFSITIKNDCAQLKCKYFLQKTLQAYNTISSNYVKPHPKL